MLMAARGMRRTVLLTSLRKRNLPVASGKVNSAEKWLSKMCFYFSLQEQEISPRFQHGAAEYDVEVVGLPDTHSEICNLNLFISTYSGEILGCSNRPYDRPNKTPLLSVSRRQE